MSQESLHGPKSGETPANFAEHQAAVAALSALAARQIYGQSEHPDFVRVIPLASTESQLGNGDRISELKAHLATHVPTLFETYLSDLQALQKVKPGAQILGSHFDPETQTLTGAPVELRDSVRSYSWSLSSRYDVYVDSVIDYTPSITRTLVETGADGSPEYAYTLNIAMSNIRTSHDPYGYYVGSEGHTLATAVIDPTYDAVYFDINGRETNRARPVESAIEVVERSLPQTWK